MSNYITETGM